MKAIALLSGGLDSLLAAKLIMAQGIETEGLFFQIPFFHRDTQALSFPEFKIRFIDIKNDFLELIREPRYGFGSNMNPCIDCKIMMLTRARKLLSETGAAFVVSGEVLGQRPMSQNRQALDLIEKKAGLNGLLLRPLSARLLAATLPEINGWVDRDKLLSISGRGRKAQLELARNLNLTGYSTPAGGCLLTDPAFSRRIKDLKIYGRLDQENIELLKIGRHFRLSKCAKLIIGRDEGENSALLNLARDQDYLFMPQEDLAGPVALARGVLDNDLISGACAIICRYCDLNGRKEAEFFYKKINSSGNFSLADCFRLTVAPLGESAINSLRI